ncbi:MAG: ATP-binding protein, partial [archaeon]|nr:ATP-binding protein [archaeon]
NSLESEQHEFDEVELNNEDIRKIKGMAADPDFFENLIKSIAPTVYGMTEEKQGVALQLFGGTRKEMDDGSILRGDIHILMVGDPGVAKSQILNYMSHLAPRGIYASGKSASAAGLCVDANTSIVDAQGHVESIGNFVNSLMVEPEEYKPGVWRQAVDGVKIQSFADFGVRYIPVSYIWKIKTPEVLYRITAGSTSLVLTAETKIQAMQGIRFDWIEAKNLKVGDMAAIILDNMRFVPISNIEIVTDNLPDYVYDLTVKTVHAFIGNGFVIHNTAAAVKDEFGGGGWTLEAGALVLADKGLACIDELDKMSTQDRSSLHEAMESQRVSVAKAGINATLQSRCSLLAAANPKFGRFDTRERIVSQIDIPPALMSRFDLIFVKYDHPDSDNDRSITEYILKTHMRGQARTLQNKTQDRRCDEILKLTDVIRPIYSADTIRKYVSYAKRNYFPILSEKARDMIEEAYLSMRKLGENIEKSVPITVRQLEAYIRLSEASAKSRWSNTVEEIDAQRSIHLVKYYMDSILRSDDSYDIDNLGQFNHRQRKSIMSANNAVKQVLKENEGRAFTVDELIGMCKGEVSRSEIEKAIEWLNENGYIFEPTPGKFVYI